ncbi:MAG TPA: aminoacyl-tRNA hydrolase [Burkholderiales bacterium]|nr:aminoacyl-tRNA hydrolase [Burkholderiales bacterium]
MKLIVGLGNPGRKYEATRHNAGFWWVDEVARLTAASFRLESRFSGQVARVPASELWLLKPETFMNHSGRAVGALAGFYRIAPADILVAHDELDLPPGSVKLKFGGGLSGNGLKDVAAVLGTRDFWRLRIGIGHPRDLAASEQEVIDYVLHPPRTDERAAIVRSMDQALEVWPQIARHDMEAAMLKLHTRPKDAAPESKSEPPPSQP